MLGILLLCSALIWLQARTERDIAERVSADNKSSLIAVVPFLLGLQKCVPNFVDAAVLEHQTSLLKMLLAFRLQLQRLEAPDA